MRRRYDLVVIGGGTGGLVAALIAAGMGARVALVERERTGGDCLWRGCVPSKSLIAAATLAHRMRHADTVGLTATEPEIDFTAVMGHVRQSIASIAPHDSPERLRAAGVEVIHAHGRFSAPGVVQANATWADGAGASEAGARGRELRWRRAIIATGSVPILPSIPGLTGPRVLSTDTIWELRSLPGRLLVLGGGAAGCELGQALARLGSAVTLVESGPRLLPREDPLASDLIARQLAADGVDVRLGSRVATVADADEWAEATVDGPAGRELLRVDTLLVATGRRARSCELGLETVGIGTATDGSIPVDRRLRTANPRVFAVGDVTGLAPHTHVAAHHARIATAAALFHARTTASPNLPRVTFTDPQVASVGLSEDQSRARWRRRCQVTVHNLRTLDRVVTDGQTDGVVKLVGDPRGRLVGATVASPYGGEMIAELTAWVSQGARIDTISRTVHAYPTFAEGSARAADEHLRARFDRPISRAGASAALALLRLLEP